MKIANVFAALFFAFVLTVPVFAAPENDEKPADAGTAAPADLSQFIYSYGTVLKVSPAEIVLQEYDYDSDVEKDVSYQLDPSVKLEGFKATADLAAEDVVEVYYLEQDGKKTAKIIRREIIEEETSPSENP